MKLALFGYGGHAREVAVQMNEPVEFFVDDEYSNEYTKPISSFDPEEYMIMVAVADSKQRKAIVETLPNNTKYFTFIHPTVLMMDKDIEIGEGSFIGAYSILTTNIRIGKHGILNRGNQIGHDCVIDDYFIVSGNVNIGEEVYIGSNSSIKEKKHIISKVIIGSNSTVVKNIITSGTYVGVPAKFLKK
jgi:sugar O-acyltransferase (sialic acid O-acetyltransferase NeuD family)